jgi:hypothetical protein
MTSATAVHNTVIARLRFIGKLLNWLIAGLMVEQVAIGT